MTQSEFVCVGLKFNFTALTVFKFSQQIFLPFYPEQKFNLFVFLLKSV